MNLLFTQTFFFDVSVANYDSSHPQTKCKGERLIHTITFYVTNILNRVDGTKNCSFRPGLTFLCDILRRDKNTSDTSLERTFLLKVVCHL